MIHFYPRVAFQEKLQRTIPTCFLNRLPMAGTLDFSNMVNPILMNKEPLRSSKVYSKK